MPASRETVQAVLKNIADPVAGGDILSSGVVRALNVDEAGAVRFVMEIPPSASTAYTKIKDEAEAALKATEGVTGDHGSVHEKIRGVRSVGQSRAFT